MDMDFQKIGIGIYSKFGLWYIADQSHVLSNNSHAFLISYRTHIDQ